MKIYQIASRNIRLYQGQSVHNKGSKFYTTDKEWARQFTQSGLDSEIRTISFPSKSIYRANPLPQATNAEEMDVIEQEARSKGFKAFWVDEGIGEPNSVYML